MKTLLLLRHAKSSWDDSAIPDHDRPLKGRGVKAARRMGHLMNEHRLRPELVLCSTAARARETLGLVLEAAGIQPAVEFSEKLYHCAPSEFPLALSDVGTTISDVMLVGHNPGLEEFLFHLTGRQEVFPTTALARLELDLSEWSQFDDQTHARLVNIWRPKELGER